MQGSLKLSLNDLNPSQTSAAIAANACGSFSGFCQDRVQQWPRQVDRSRDLRLPGAWIFHLETRCCSKGRSQRGAAAREEDACCCSEVTRDQFSRWLLRKPKAGVAYHWSPFNAATQRCPSASWRPTNHNTQQKRPVHHVMHCFLLKGSSGVSWNGSLCSCDATSDHSELCCI